MALEPRTPLVPYHEAHPDTQAAYLRGLKNQRDLDGNPEAWHCTRCGETAPGDDVLVSYGVGDTPIPYCPAQGCGAYGPELKPAEP
jgi:NAD-dependent SIR2 family protein deacetylase